MLNVSNASALPVPVSDSVSFSTASAGSKRSSAPAPPMARSSDAENLLPISESVSLSSSAGSKRRKTYDECSESHQRKLRADARLRYEFASHLAHYPWLALNLALTLTRCDKVFQEIFGEGSKCQPIVTFPPDFISEKHRIREAVYFKDSCNISGMQHVYMLYNKHKMAIVQCIIKSFDNYALCFVDKHWTLLSQRYQDYPMPTLFQVKKETQELNSSSPDVLETPETRGVQQSLRKLLKEQVVHHMDIFR